MKWIISIFALYLFHATLIPSPLRAQQANYTIEPVAQDLSVPWSIIAPDADRLLISERDGTIVELQRHGASWQKNTLHILPDTEQQAEAGLMGLAIDPLYPSNRFMYAMYAYEAANGLAARVVRFTDEGTALTDQQTIIDMLPCAQYHCGGRIAFGPDNKLYIAVGDARQPQEAQSTSSLHGSILRINTDGSIPPDNPFGNAVWSYGHRNIQGLSWHPETAHLFATEHGPSGIDGFGGGDEINHIEKGNNYGWPHVSHRKTDARFTAPVWLFSPDGPPAIAPASAHIVQHRDHPWFGDLLIGTLFEGDIIRCEIAATAITGCFHLGLSDGRIRDITESSDGTIFFSTSNTDGRSTVSGSEKDSSDDHIYALTIPLSEREQGSTTDQTAELIGEPVSGSVKKQSIWSHIKNILLWPVAVISNILR